MKKRWNIRYGPVYLCIFVLTMITVLFFLFMMGGSLKSSSQLSHEFGMIMDGGGENAFAVFRLFPEKFSMEQYRKVLWDTSDFWYYFWNSAGYTIAIIAGNVIVAVLAGVALAKGRFPLKKFWLIIFIVVMMIPYQVMVSPTFMVLNKMHLVDHRLAIVLPNIFTPFGCYLLYQFISQIPDGQIQAAKVDGAGTWRIIFRIIIPQIRGGIVSLIILNMIDLWNMVEQPLMYLKNEFKYPLSASISYFQNQDYGSAFVCGVVFTFPVIIAFSICKKQLVNGIRNSVIGNYETIYFSRDVH